MKLAIEARDFALQTHSLYDNFESVKTHLTSVTDKLDEICKDYFSFYDKDNNPVIAAGWLHDIVEDTNVTLQMIENDFGKPISNLVNYVTDREGKNRKERHINTYYITRRSELATLIKLCDRWHNHQRSIDNNYSKLSMYFKEYDYFKFALYDASVDLHKKLWADLDNQYKIMYSMKNNKGV